MRFIQSLKLAGLLSFPPDMEPFELEDLNVLIGPNGSGKSNLIEVFELLRALPTDFAAALREGGGAREWIWKGDSPARGAQIGLTACAPLYAVFEKDSAVDYLLGFYESFERAHIFREILSKEKSLRNDEEPEMYYKNDCRGAGIWERVQGDFQYRRLDGNDISFDQSILAQIRDPGRYSALSWLGSQFSLIHIFREWAFGHRAAVRRPQRTDLPGDRLLPDASNLAVIVNNLDSWGRRQEFNELLKRFFPRVERLSTPVIGGTVQLLLHETGFDTPIPATRISDGTLRFIAMLAVLLSPEPPPLVCIEEPELGLHPDAVMLMGDVLEEASERMQLVVTTHSDALVSELTNRPSAIVACERPGAGTMLRRLDPEHVAHWLDEYALGDIWRMGALGANP